MKPATILLVTLFFSLAVFSQGNNPNTGEKNKGNSGKVKDKKIKEEQSQKDKDKDRDKQDDVAKQRSHEEIVWDGTYDKGGKGPKLSKNIPDKVRRSFQRDYPLAVNVTWYKYRGDWTATHFHGIFTSTAVYHANGERRDTRTPIPRTMIPVKIEDIFRNRPSTRLEDIIKIDIPARDEIYRLKTIVDGVSKFLFYDRNGLEVPYNY